MITAGKGPCFASKEVQCGSSLHYRLSKGASPGGLPNGPSRHSGMLQPSGWPFTSPFLPCRSRASPLTQWHSWFWRNFLWDPWQFFVLGLAPFASPSGLWFAILSLLFTSNQRSLTSTIGYRDGLDAVWWAPSLFSPIARPAHQESKWCFILNLSTHVGPTGVDDDDLFKHGISFRIKKLQIKNTGIIKYCNYKVT